MVRNPLKRLPCKRIVRFGCIVVLVWLGLALVLGLVIHFYGLIDRAQPADVIIVLGSGLEADGRPGPALIRRATHAAALWQQGLAPQIMCAGGTPGRTDANSEAAACAAILRDQNVPETVIFLEDQSRSTEENAIYSLGVMQANGWNTAVIVSDGFHLLRAGWIFQARGVIGYLSPVSETPPGMFEYLVAVGREILALHWQVFKEVFQLPVTYVNFF